MAPGAGIWLVSGMGVERSIGVGVSHTWDGRCRRMDRMVSVWARAPLGCHASGMEGGTRLALGHRAWDGIGGAVGVARGACRMGLMGEGGRCIDRSGASVSPLASYHWHPTDTYIYPALRRATVSRTPCTRTS